jgi:hypothetical protein
VIYKEEKEMMNIKKYNKTIVALIFASILLSSVFVGITFGFMSGISTGGADYAVLEGAAGGDYYDSTQYSYQVNSWLNSSLGVPGYGAAGAFVNPATMSMFNAGKSLRVGLTEFGEMATPANAGIAYGEDAVEMGNTESWASTAIDVSQYIQGWVFYMNYTRATTKRAIEAWGLYSDYLTAEGARQVVSWDGHYLADELGWSPTDGEIITNGVEILYDSARLAVARTTLAIRDLAFRTGNTPPGEDVAQITFTVIMNKDTKYAIVYKDLKILLDTKVLDYITDLSFSERYEIDLAKNVNLGNKCFIHYYHNWSSTVYQHPVTGSNTYDLVQAYDPGHQYNFFAAYWPNATEYSVYSSLVPNPYGGSTNVLPFAYGQPDIPLPEGEPGTPWVIAQWRYQNFNPSGPDYYPNLLKFLASGLTTSTLNREIRFVEVVGMTDYNVGNTVYNTSFKAKDFNDTTLVANNVDGEIQYLVNGTVFNPEDMSTASTGMYAGRFGAAGSLPYRTSYYEWDAVGNASAATDSAGSSMLSQIGMLDDYGSTLALFDRPESIRGTIPYGLSSAFYTVSNNYVDTFTILAENGGTDPTTFYRTGLNNFAFNTYDNVPSTEAPQPIAGGYSVDAAPHAYWYPSVDPLTQRWTGAMTALSPYTSIHNNGIMSVGGPKANQLSRYFNDFNFAIDREAGTQPASALAAVSPYYSLISGGSVYGYAPTSDAAGGTLDFFPLSTWNTSNATAILNTGVTTLNIKDTFGYGAGYAVIALARDINGTRGLSVYGWDGRDTYWASAWATEFLGLGYNAWVPPGTVALILKISYSSANSEPTAFTVVRDLGTITEMGFNQFATIYGFDQGPVWSTYYSSSYRTNVLLSPAAVTPLTPTYPAYADMWWWQKLPTWSTALVDFDA